MKTLDEITRLSAEDLERISLDGSIPVPEELSLRVQEALDGTTADHAGNTHRRGFSRTKPSALASLRWLIPAAAAVAVLLTVGLKQEPEPRDTFDDPYLAYAEVEKVFSKISGTVAYGASKINETEVTLDKINYWK